MILLAAILAVLVFALIWVNWSITETVSRQVHWGRAEAFRLSHVEFDGAWAEFQAEFRPDVLEAA